MKITSDVTRWAERVRDGRLQQERFQRRKDREDLVGRAYLHFLKKIQPSTIPFMPSLDVILSLRRVSDAIQDDAPVSDHLQRTIDDALVLSWSRIIHWIDTGAQQLRNIIPDDWSRGTRNALRITPTFSAEDSLQDLDLVSHVWTCQSCTEPHHLYGLDALAHQFMRTPVGLNHTHMQPAQRAHLAVIELLSLLNLNPAQTTVSNMRRIADSKLFICTRCDHDTQSSSTIFSRSWTSAVSRHG